MRSGVAQIEKMAGRVQDQGLLFEYLIKFAVLAAFFELVLYRLVSRLGMHLSKLAAKYDVIRITFKGLSSLGFALLNVTAIFVFFALVILLMKKLHERALQGANRLIVPLVSLLLLLTAGFLAAELLQVSPSSGMVRSMIYNLVAFVLLTVLVGEYVVMHRDWTQRALGIWYFLGVSGWLYYQTLSTTYGWLGILMPAPFVHEINRAGEACMVLASILVFWAYGSVSLRSRNKIQRHRAMWFWIVAVVLFGLLFFLDYLLVLYDPQVAQSVRKAGEGISWIFQMGMGYTFYLPFAFYVTGLLCWSYTVIKLMTMGRLAGYGLALMFMAGYALQLSHLTLMVVLGLMLVNLDRRRVDAVSERQMSDVSVVSPSGTLITERT